MPYRFRNLGLVATFALTALPARAYDTVPVTNSGRLHGVALYAGKPLARAGAHAKSQ
jgi:hypothetical protein